MSKQTISSLIRAFFMIVSAFLVGHHIGSQAIDQTFLDTAGAVVLGVVSMVWGIADKSTGLEAFEATIKQVLVFGGGLLVATGKLTADNLNNYIGVATMLLPVLWSWVSKKKAAQAG